MLKPSHYRTSLTDFEQYENLLVSHVPEGKTYYIAIKFSDLLVFEHAKKIFNYKLDNYCVFFDGTQPILVFKSKRRRNYKWITKFAIRLVAYSLGLLPDIVIPEGNTCRIEYTQRSLVLDENVVQNALRLYRDVDGATEDIRDGLPYAFSVLVLLDYRPGEKDLTGKAPDDLAHFKTPPVLTMKTDALVRYRFLKRFFMPLFKECIKKEESSWWTIERAPAWSSHLYYREIYGCKFSNRARLILFDIDDRTNGLKTTYEIASRLKAIGVPEHAMIISLRQSPCYCSVRKDRWVDSWVDETQQCIACGTIPGNSMDVAVISTDGDLEIVGNTKDNHVHDGFYTYCKHCPVCGGISTGTSCHLIILLQEAVPIGHLAAIGARLLKQIGIRVSGVKGYFDIDGKTIGIDIFPCKRGVRLPFGINSFNFIPFHEEQDLFFNYQPVSVKVLPNIRLKKPTDKQMYIIKDMVLKKRLPDKDYDNLSAKEAYDVIKNAIPKPTERQLSIIRELHAQLGRGFDESVFLGMSGEEAYEYIKKLHGEIRERKKQEKLKLHLKEKGPLIRSIRLIEQTGIPRVGMRHNLTRQYMLMLRKYLGNKATADILFERAVTHLLQNPNSKFSTPMEKAIKDTRALAEDVMKFTKDLTPKRDLKLQQNVITLSPYGDKARLTIETIVKLANKYSLFTSIFSTSIQMIADESNLSPTTIRRVIRNTRLKINGKIIPLIIGIRKDTFCYIFAFDVNEKEALTYFKKFPVDYNKGINKIISSFSQGGPWGGNPPPNPHKPLGCHSETALPILEGCGPP